MASIKYWAWLSCISGVRPLVKYKLLNALGGAEQVFFAGREELEAGGAHGAELERLCSKSMEAAFRTMDDCRDKGVQLLTLQDAAYPECLRQIADPPVVLYIIGHLPPADEEPLVAVIGTRKASAYGLRTAAKMGRELAEAGCVVVSGLAAGCDGAAMEAALRAGGTVVGVLGTAIDQVYPRQNRWLFDETRTRGALVSEYPPGVRTYPTDFLARNRIITGLSLGLVVAEAPIRSGTQSTVSRALEQGRDVFAVPGNVDAAASEGCNYILAQGAMVAKCGADVVAVYEGQRVFRPRPALAIPIKKEIDKAKDIVYIGLTDDWEELPPAQRQVLAAMTRPDMLADEIIQAAGLAAPEAAAALTMLELSGHIVCGAGRRYTRRR